MGSPIYQGHQPAADAACVALVRAAGAVILGKTVTCEFAGMSPGSTVNPHNRAHTPGGSSSGSAAAVADWMVPAAFGTQTGGLIRPSAYCGVFGFKPTFGVFSRRGVYPAAESLDTIGLIARSLDDVELISAVLELRTAPTHASPASGEAKGGGSFDRAPRIGLCRTPLWSEARPETTAAIEDAARRLGKAGALVREVMLPEEFSGLRHAARETINNCERAAAMAWEWAHHRPQISDRLSKRIAIGCETPHAEYVAALRLGDDCRARLPVVFADFDALLAPATHGEAPRGLADTGDPGFQAIWTILHVPTVTLPTHRGPNGLPVGIQLVGRQFDDRRLMACARWVWDKIGTPEAIGVRG
jgi:amidase